MVCSKLSKKCVNVEVEEQQEQITVSFTYQFAISEELRVTVAYTVKADGSMLVRSIYEGASNLPQLPIHALSFKIPADYENVEWYALGPDENYSDRAEGARLGIFHTNVQEDMSKYVMPQVWTSDNTDAVSRLKIQYGTSLVYPIVTMGAHVSAVPNHQVHRSTSLQMRGDVAMSGNLGYELDTTDLTDEEKVAVREQTAIYKQRRQLIQFGDFYRLKSPFEGNETAWMFTNQEKSEAIVFYFSVLAEPSASFKRLKVSGLDTTKKYQLVGSDKVFGGDELSYVGLHIPAELVGDFQSHVWEFKEV